MPNNLSFYTTLDLRKNKFSGLFFFLFSAHPSCPVLCCPFLRQQLQCMTSLSVYLCVPEKKAEYHRRDSLTTPFSPTPYGLLVRLARCWSCQQSSELQRRWKQKPRKRTQTTVQRIQGETEGRDEGKGLGVGSGLAGALRQSLNKAGGEREKRREREERAAGPGLPRTHHQLLLDCLLESNRATPHISTPISFPPLRNDHQSPPSITTPSRKPPV